jgi:hypothetical protein
LRAAPSFWYTLPGHRERERTIFRIRILRTVRDLGGNLYPEGSVVEARFARDGVAEVLGAQYLPLGPEEWEPALSKEDLERLLEG